MPLSKPVRRRLQHRRKVECRGFLREDGLWDIEARMLDLKADTVELPLRGDVPAGEPIHDLGLRVTLDQQMLIHEVEAFIDDSPFPQCPAITSAFKKLEGTRIGPGWQRQCRDRVGGALGCTHLNELLQPIATTAIQTMWPNSDIDVMRLGADLMVNSCHSWAQNSDVIKTLLPDRYKPYPAGAMIEKESL